MLCGDCEINYSVAFLEYVFNSVGMLCLFLILWIFSMPSSDCFINGLLAVLVFWFGIVFSVFSVLFLYPAF